MNDDFITKCGEILVQTMAKEIECEQQKLSVKIVKSKKEDTLYNIYLQNSKCNVDFALTFTGSGQAIDED